MVDIKNAARAAEKYFRSLFGGKAYDMQLEEAEYSKDGIYILITLSFRDSPYVGFSSKGRKYKIFKINASTGEVESMKIRVL